MKNWENILGVISSFLLFVTIILLLLNYKEGKYYFLAFAFYLVQIMFLNMLSAKIINVSPGTRSVLGILNNLLDLPLMMIFLQYFVKDDKMKKIFWYIAGLYLLFDLILYFLMGWTITWLTTIIGPGLLIVTAISFYFFVDQLKTAILSRRETGKAFLTGAIVFAYLCFTLIYIMFYLLKSKYISDIYAIYYITFIIFSLCLIIGIYLIMQSRRKKTTDKMQLAKREDENSFQFL